MSERAQGEPVPLRIVSLLPSATELVCALGARDALVGISHECDFPAAVRGLPVLTRSRIDAHASSSAVDQAVREVIRDALSLYAVDEGLLGALEPDVVVTQDLCEVCAVSLDSVQAAVSRLGGRRDVRIVSLSPTRLAHVYDDVERVAVAIARPDAGRALRSELESRVRNIRERAARVAARPRVVSLEWIEPLMLGGTWMPELIEAAGGTPVGARAGEPAPTISSRELAALEPEVIVIKPCGFTLERTLAERDVIERSVLASARPGTRVYLTDGNAFFNRPGPRLVESLEIMAACIHPPHFGDFEHVHRPFLTRLG